MLIHHIQNNINVRFMNYFHIDKLAVLIVYYRYTSFGF